MSFYKNINPLVSSFNEDCPGRVIPGQSPTTSLKKNVVIDYLKVRFSRSFNYKDNKFRPLLNALKVQYDIFDKNTVLPGGCVDSYTYDATVNIFNFGDNCLDSNGERIWCLEMKGQTCREFEQRDGDWLILFKEIMKLNGTCTRIDLTLDDFENSITKKELLNKIYKREYVSCYKNAPVIIVNNGFSITFGRNSKKTLCIYDKLLEREDKNIPVLVDSWMRYESRFKENQGHEAFLETINALENNTLDILVKSLIKGLVDFKTRNNYSEKNKDKAKTWTKRNKLLDESERIKISNQGNIEKSITKSCLWLGNSATRIRMLAELVDPDMYVKYDGFNVFNHIGKITKSDIAKVNYLRSDLGLEKISYEDAIIYLHQNYDDCANEVTYLSHLVNLNKKEMSERVRKKEMISQSLEGIVKNY